MTLRKLLGFWSLTLWLLLSSITAYAVTCGESKFLKETEFLPLLSYLPQYLRLHFQ